MKQSSRLALAMGAVISSMVVLFAVPPQYFAAATFFSTGVMILAAYALGALGLPRRVSFASIGIGVVSAFILYFVFYGGAAAIDALHPFGITSSSETSIYSLIASPSNPLVLQVGVLLFDSAGYEAFFRGVLQKRLTPRLGVGAAPVVAAIDAALHLVTLNPLWVGATFVTDLFWGLTFHYGRGTQASFTSHLVWDLAIFIVRPIM